LILKSILRNLACSFYPKLENTTVYKRKKKREFIHLIFLKDDKNNDKKIFKRIFLKLVTQKQAINERVISHTKQ